MNVMLEYWPSFAELNRRTILGRIRSIWYLFLVFAILLVPGNLNAREESAPGYSYKGFIVDQGIILYCLVPSGGGASKWLRIGDTAWDIIVEGATADNMVVVIHDDRTGRDYKLPMDESGLERKEGPLAKRARSRGISQDRLTLKLSDGKMVTFSLAMSNAPEPMPELLILIFGQDGYKSMKKIRNDEMLSRFMDDPLALHIYSIKEVDYLEVSSRAQEIWGKWR